MIGLGHDIVVKYGLNIGLEEANATTFVTRNTSLPVPKVLGKYKYGSTDCLHLHAAPKGTPLSGLLYSLSGEEHQTIAEDLKAYITELRALYIEDFESSHALDQLSSERSKPSPYEEGRLG